MAVALRRARPGDALSIRQLLVELGYQIEPRRADETIMRVIQHPESRVLVATEGHRVVGFVAVSHRPQMHLGGTVASIDELVVSDAHRGHGVGTKLVEAAIQIARELQCRRIELTQRRSRESYQRRFCVERGFTEVDSAILRIEL